MLSCPWRVQLVISVCHTKTEKKFHSNTFRSKLDSVLLSFYTYTYTKLTTKLILVIRRWALELVHNSIYTRHGMIAVFHAVHCHSKETVAVTISCRTKCVKSSSFISHIYEDLKNLLDSCRTVKIQIILSNFWSLHKAYLTL